MENLTLGFQSSVFIAALRNNLQQKPLQFVATADIGWFAANAFVNQEDWNHHAIGLAGDEVTVDQLSQSFNKATGKPAPEAWWFLGSALTTLSHEMGVMIRWFASDGYKADINARRKEHPGLMTLEQWLRQKHAEQVDLKH
jgi:hypothetical protein